MIGGHSEDPPLRWELLIKRRPSLTQGIPPGKELLAWVANTVTLIYGERDAILVDTFLTEEHSRELADWVVAAGKNLTTIYVTHAHGDHFFGLGILQDRFPQARAVATPDVVKGMYRQVSPDMLRASGGGAFPARSRSLSPSPRSSVSVREQSESS